MKSRERNSRKIDNLCAYVYISDLNTYSLGLHVCVRMFVSVCTKLFTLPKQLPSCKWQVLYLLCCLSNTWEWFSKDVLQCLRCFAPFHHPHACVCNLGFTFNKQYKFTVNNCLGFCLWIYYTMQSSLSSNSFLFLFTSPLPSTYDLRMWTFT